MRKRTRLRVTPDGLLCIIRALTSTAPITEYIDGSPIRVRHIQWSRPTAYYVRLTQDQIKRVQQYESN